MASKVDKPAADKEGRAARRRDGRLPRGQSTIQRLIQLAARDLAKLPEETISARPSRARGRKDRLPSLPSSTFSVIRRALRSGASTRRKSTGSRDERTTQTFSSRQRCSVRVTYTSSKTAGHFQAHGRYLMRESAAGERGVMGTLGEESLPDALARWQRSGDPRVWKMILSPEFGDRVNLKQLTERLVGAIEHDLRTTFEWAAVEHRNTDHPHVHLVVRGVDHSGIEIRFSPDYLKNAIREHAEALCTAQLGHRTALDVEQARNREIEQFRFTSLDRQIDRQADTTPFDPSLQGHAVEFPDAPVLRSRLRFLARAGVVQDLSGERWLIGSGFEQQLRNMSMVADRQRLLAQTGAAISDNSLPHRVTPPQDAGPLRGRVLGHVEDEATSSPTMILEGTDGSIHFIRHDVRIGRARSQGHLKANHFVAFSPKQLQDLGDADKYIASPQFRAVPQDAERTAARQGFGGWLGAYYARLLQPSAIAQTLEPKLELETELSAERDDFEL